MYDICGTFYWMFYDLNGEILVNFIHQIEHKMANNVDHFIGYFLFSVHYLHSFPWKTKKNRTTTPKQNTHSIAIALLDNFIEHQYYSSIAIMDIYYNGGQIRIIFHDINTTAKPNLAYCVCMSIEHIHVRPPVDGK